jgi:hypothetical protein
MWADLFAYVRLSQKLRVSHSAEDLNFACAVKPLFEKSYPETGGQFFWLLIWHIILINFLLDYICIYPVFV